MRPKITINCAMSVDGKIALPERIQTRISSDDDIARVHALRGTHDAILVGVGTVLEDDPKLTVKKELIADDETRDIARQPLRVVLDSDFRTPLDAEVFKSPPPTMICVKESMVGQSCGEPGRDDWISRCSCYGPASPHDVMSGAHLVAFREAENGLDLDQVLECLERQHIKSLLVEGGGTVIWSFLSQGLFDKLSIFVGDMVIGGKGSPTMADGPGAQGFDKVLGLKFVDCKRMDGGVLLEYEKAI